MEPFQLSLTQVSFDSHDSSFQQPVSSFGNLVSYDCDLKVDTEDTKPLKSQVVQSEY